MTEGYVLHKVLRFLRENGMKETTFGRLAMKDPNFVLQLRRGRIPSPKTEKKLDKFMGEYFG